MIFHLEVFAFLRTENSLIRIRNRIRTRIELIGWIRIRIETNADPKHCLYLYLYLYLTYNPHSKYIGVLENTAQ